VIIHLNDIDVKYINLDKEKERKEAVEQLLKPYFKNYSRISAYDRDNVVSTKEDRKFIPSQFAYNHAVAVAQSHIKALKSIKKFPTLILEDDLALRNKPPKYFDVPDDADAVYLGVSSSSFKYTGDYFMRSYETWQNESVDFNEYEGNDDFYRIYGMLCCHAIMYLNQEFVNKTIEAFSKALTTGVPIDLIQHHLQQTCKTYAINKTIFKQQYFTGLSNSSDFDLLDYAPPLVPLTMMITKEYLDDEDE